MQALIYTQTGTLEVLQVRSVDAPRPKKDQVQIAVRACALNIGDYQRFVTKNGQIPTTTKLTNKLMGYVGKPLGAEVAGVVTAVGSAVTQVKVGEAVYGKAAGTAPAGGLAEYAILDEGRVYQKPNNLSFEEASCISISFETALGAVRKAKIKPGQNVMVYGASGGVGLYAVQLAKAFGATVTGVCSTRNLELAKSVGCAQVIDYKTQDFTQCATVFDAILGINGCNPMKTYKPLLKPSGTFVGVGDTKQGVKAMMASLTSKQFTFFIGPAMPQKDYLKVGKKLAEAGKVMPHIDGVFSVKDTANAIAYAIKTHPQGKLVIKTDFV